MWSTAYCPKMFRCPIWLIEPPWEAKLIFLGFGEVLQTRNRNGIKIHNGKSKDWPRLHFSINSCRGFVHCNFAMVILGISVKILMEAMETNGVIVIFHLVLEWNGQYVTTEAWNIQNRVNLFIVLHPQNSLMSSNLISHLRCILHSNFWVNKVKKNFKYNN